MDEPTPKKRGRPPGSKTRADAKPREKTGPRPGSRPHMLANMELGERTFLEAPQGRVQAFMQQIGADITRGNLQGKITQTLILGIEPATRQVYELVMLTRKED